MKEQLCQIIAAALQQCYANQQLDSGVMPEEIQLEIPKNPEHGDFATNLAMTLAKAEGKAPRQIAAALTAVLEQNVWFEKIEIAGPGFINFRLCPESWHGVLRQIEQQAEGYGRVAVGRGIKVQVEFVSANPTGPL